MAKPVWTDSQVVGQLDSGAHWSSTNLTYGFPSDANWFLFSEKNGFSTLNSAQQFSASLAIRLWDDLIVPDFALAANGASANIKYSNTTTNISYAHAYYPGNWFGAGSIWFNSNYGANSGTNNLVSPTVGAWGFQTYIHETGHALGLDHPGEYNGGSPTYANDALYAQDSQMYTVMSYFTANNTGADWVASNGRAYYPQTPMLHDVMAIQAMYGVETTTRTGNTTYGFNSNADVWVYDFTQNQHPVLCIFDSAGTDTLDLSGWSYSCTIDLAPGAYSGADMMTYNISIAQTAWIENGVGGGGNDTLSGNQIDNRLSGNAGNDLIFGGAGNDTAVYQGARFQYQISLNGDGSLRLADLRSGAPNGTDSAYDIEFFQFSDGVFATDTLIAAMKPDLIAYAGLSSTTIAAGSNVSVDFWNANFGMGLAAASTTRLYISTNALIDTSDTVLATLNSSDLTGYGGANWYDHRSVSVTLPGSLAPGTYYVGGISDYANAIVESDEANTWNVTQITVTAAPKPDLMAYAGLSATTVVAGSNVAVDFWNANFGAGAAAASATRLYLSSDAIIDTSDAVLATLNTAALTGHGGANWYDHRSVSVTLPGSLAPGTYYVGGISDYANAIVESDEANTWNVTQITVTAAPKPDLMAYAGLSATTVVAGSNVAVDFWNANFGAGAAAASATRLYLSSDAIIDTSDAVLATLNTAALTGHGGANWYDHRSVSVTLPGSLAPGTYYVGGISDYANAIVESDEANTWNVTQITVTAAPKPDLMAYAGLSATTVVAGSNVAVDFWNANFGAGAAAASATRLYLSSDAIIDTSDAVLATLNTAALTGHGGANWYDHRSVSVTLPGSLAPGTYYVGGISDYANAIVESDEANTWNVTQITVLPDGGSDTFVFAPAFGHQTVANFDPGYDVIELSSSIFADAASALAAASDDGHGNTVIAVDPNNSIVLDGILKTQLSASDFHVV